MLEKDKIPFGKYKGKELSVLFRDSEYMEWVLAQPWVKEKYPDFYNIITNNHSSVDTPEHNIMQALFFEESFCEELLNVLVPEGRSACVEEDETPNGFRFRTIPEVCGLDIMFIGQRLYFSKGKRFQKYIKVLFELKPTVGEDFPAILRQVKTAKEISMTRMFTGKFYEEHGISFGNPYFMVIVKDFTCRSVPYETVKKMFSAAGIVLITQHSITDHIL